jgi:hypothetical protein
MSKKIVFKEDGSTEVIHIAAALDEIPIIPEQQQKKDPNKKKEKKKRKRQATLLKEAEFHQSKYGKHGEEGPEVENIIIDVPAEKEESLPACQRCASKKGRKVHQPRQADTRN